VLEKMKPDTAIIKAVLFDLDQTLVDFLHQKRESCRAAIRAMVQSGLPIAAKKAEKLLFEIYDRHGIEDPQVFQRFLRKTSGRVDYKLLAKAVAAYRNLQRGLLKPYPHTKRVLSALQKRGYRLGVVSDAPRLKAHLRLAELGLLDYFDVIVTLDDTGRLKPHPRPFQVAARKLELKPDQILFVGDNPERDILGARNTGMETAWARYGYPKKYVGPQSKSTSRSKPDYTLDKIQDLLRINFA
ncbi:MAG: TIGR02253 family HAD-type hydrolase, partial [Candidatus Diapherotrites archaeon]|nr:TIGR02253 family HAD-type hydrolase [Candidatus Diapherotrites archaeon]